MLKFLRPAVAGLLAFAMLASPLAAIAGNFEGKAFYGLDFRYKGSNDLGTPLIDVPALAATIFNTGTGEYQSDLVFSDVRTLAPSATEDLDVIGSLTDAFGTTINMLKVTAVIIYADPTNTNNVVVGNATQPVSLGFGAATHTWAVPPGGWFSVGAPEAGWTAGAGATDDIKILNSAGGTSVNYTVIILGRTA